MGVAQQTDSAVFLPLKEAANRLGVPADWLKRQAESKSVPSLKVGGKLRFHIASVETELLARTTIESGKKPSSIGESL